MLKPITMDIDEALSAHRSSFNEAGDLLLQRNKEDVVASLRQLIIGKDVIEQLLNNDSIRSQSSKMTMSDGLEAVQKVGNSITNRRAQLDPIENPVDYFLRILSRYEKDGEVAIALKRLGEESIGEEDVVASLRQLSIGADVIEPLLSNDRIRSQLSGMSRSDGLEAVQKLGDSITKRRADLDPIESPVGYFLRILSRYKKDGEVVIALKRLGKKSIGEDVVDTILSNEKVRAQLSLLSKAEGLEAVDKLGESLAKRSADLDAIRDIAGYFYKIVSRYDVKNNKKKRRGNDVEQSHYDDNNDSDDDQEDYDDQDLQSELRLAKRRAGTFQTKYQKAERTVAKLEEKLSDLTSELKNTKKELDLLKNRV
mmetsp:Transcript_10746/g.13118  ORF Transcript_10746/g.13118 Transcript_10746/m.13118 type:complete len:368 (-) Transcript_10746:174-1277(-)